MERLCLKVASCEQEGCLGDCFIKCQNLIGHTVKRISEASVQEVEASLVLSVFVHATRIGRHWRSPPSMYSDEIYSLTVVEWNFFLLLLNCSAWVLLESCLTRFAKNKSHLCTVMGTIWIECNDREVSLISAQSRTSHSPNLCSKYFARAAWAE